jgi:hypothetical protein
MFHVTDSTTNTFFSGWKDSVGTERRVALFSRIGTAYKFLNTQLAFNYRDLFQSQGRACGVVEVGMDERTRRLTYTPVGDTYFSTQEIRRLLGAISNSGVR